ncbi:glycolate oxidase FAD binding subunit [Noviherbaspirillum humi]|uniref:Glycolate oxidase FAD binding subunit n=1 Tax=Noviherbaspirillum humi TaxID=1688639 RepID=A0A239ED67_9BURK|nr:glycolate oxidase subunit GlcE [Noviherbaspirillum humi]SNS42547.1 glycolate oxidase FAD binding subunit [Noviherbaspirillum humi]
MEPIIQEFRQRILDAGNSRQPLRIRGGGSKDWYGQALNGEVLDTRAYSGIVAYDPTELVITARAGTPLAEVEQALAQHNQILAFEPPHFGPGATIGGVVAAGLSGPRRQAAGAVRDFVLGAVLMDGKGDILHFGGQVMKNVAGYDVSRLLAGSLGTLGLILEVSLKVLPRPLMETTLRFSMEREEAIRRLNEWGGQPLPISASAWHGGVLLVRLSGAPAAIEAAIARMGGEQVPDADGLWLSLREQSNDFFGSLQPAASLWRLSLPTHAKPLTLDGDELIEWGGAQRWLKTTASADAIRAAAKEAGGHASLFRGGDKAIGVFHPLPPAIARIHGGLKKAFDPAGIFNVGRLYPEF